MKINTILRVFLLISLFSCTGGTASQEQEEVITITTKFGDMVAILYDKAPNHKKNFLAIAQAGKYDSTFFHKIIQEYTIQGGDTGRTLLQDSPGEISAEIVPDLFHQKGAISAARYPDAMNPNRLSHSSQFFITQGSVYTPESLQYLENLENAKILNDPLYTILSTKRYPELNARMDSLKKHFTPEEVSQKMVSFRKDLFKILGPLKEVKYTEAQKKYYTTKGGRPDLDGKHTVFGQIISGLSLIDSISKVELDRFGIPVETVYMKVSVEMMSKAEVEEKYGYEYE